MLAARLAQAVVCLLPGLTAVPLNRLHQQQHYTYVAAILPCMCFLLVTRPFQVASHPVLALSSRCRLQHSAATDRQQSSKPTLPVHPNMLQ